ncbi:MAG: TIGR03557 family F420-dependent LLM class oxidoreductase [Acidimicrobiia bacterium]|nr:TIGR03557 family F420-dependent LLM class oxidoreductase [Acidimicrobiia bacterium]MDH4309216.1 TIGR03557 family F420-dependent LLM class oxidoreductase [Acidimicrobiia bacterium]
MVKFGWLCSHESYQPEILVNQAMLAEEAGFDMVLGSDHFHPWVDDDSAAGFVWSWLGAVAARTELELATSVTCPLYHYHPGLIAQAAATVDRLSGGKLFLGVGTGENINEGPLGFEFGDYKERIGRMREALEIMHRLFAGEKLDFEGEWYTTDKAKLYSPPLGKLPILMAAGGPQSATFAGRRADGLITSVKNPADTIEKVIDPYLASATEHGNDTTILATRWTVFAADRDEAWRALGTMRGLRAEGRLEAVDPMVLRERADTMDRDEILDKYTIVHDVEGLVDAYSELVSDVGADYVSIQVASTDPDRVLDIMKTEVLPELRRL